MSMGSGDRRLFVNGEFVQISAEMHQDLKFEAQRLNISEAEAYERERAAESEVLKKVLSNERLLKLAEKYPPPQAWFDQDEEDLFG